MSMPLGFASKVSFSSMRRRWVRTILALFPCVLLIAVLFVGATIPNGVVNEVDKKILKSAESRQEIVNLESYLFAQTEGGPEFGNVSSYNKKLYDLATKAPQVAEVYPQYGNILVHFPTLGNIEHVDLSIAGNNEEFAKLYTAEEFKYKKGEPVPLLLNPANLTSEQYNFGSSDKITADYSNPKSFDGKVEAKVLKDAEKLLGKTISVDTNQFNLVPGIIEEYANNGTGVTISKVKQSDIASINKRLAQQYGQYWNIDQLKEQTKVEFKIVGIIRGQSGYEARAYIPNGAAVDLFNQQYQLQKKARTNTVIPSDFYESQESKMVLKDGKLSESFSTGSYRLSKGPEESIEDMQLMIAPSAMIVESTKSQFGPGFKESNVKKITAENFNPAGAVVRLESPEKREDYMEYLKKNGIEIYDQSPLAAIKTIRKWSNTIVTWLTIILGSIAALILLTTMGRFVADSRREIGVWRAIGATKFDIKKLVWTRMGWLLIMAISIGILIGFGVSYYLASQIASSVNESAAAFNPYASQSFIGSIVISFLGGEVPSFDRLGLLATDWYLLLTRLGLLSLIAMVLCLLPARRASRISPVIAIRDSE